MKKTGILNKDISEIVASMGHTDMITVCDAGLPIPASVKRIDLAVKPGIPKFLDVLSSLAEELEVESIILAEELKQKNPSLVNEVAEIFPGVQIDFISHENFKLRTSKSRAVIRTGECTPYSNVILVSGVIF